MSYPLVSPLHRLLCLWFIPFLLRLRASSPAASHSFFGPSLHPVHFVTRTVENGAWSRAAGGCVNQLVCGQKKVYSSKILDLYVVSVYIIGNHNLWCHLLSWVARIAWAIQESVSLRTTVLCCGISGYPTVNKSWSTSEAEHGPDVAMENDASC